MAIITEDNMYYNDEDRPTGGSKAHIPTGGSKACTNCGGSWWDKMKRELMNGQRKYLGYYTYGLMKADACAMQCDGYRGGSCYDKCMGGSGKTSEYFKPSKPRCKITKHLPEWIRGECCFFC